MSEPWEAALVSLDVAWKAFEAEARREGIDVCGMLPWLQIAIEAYEAHKASAVPEEVNWAEVAVAQSGTIGKLQAELAKQAQEIKRVRQGIQKQAQEIERLKERLAQEMEYPVGPRP
jgi:hypothetical protein